MLKSALEAEASILIAGTFASEPLQPLGIEVTLSPAPQILNLTHLEPCWLGIPQESVLFPRGANWALKAIIQFSGWDSFRSCEATYEMCILYLLVYVSICFTFPFGFVLNACWKVYIHVVLLFCFKVGICCHFTVGTMKFSWIMWGHHNRHPMRITLLKFQ